MDRDEAAGIETWHHYDPVTEICTIETKQDVTEIVASNKSVFAATDERANWRDGMGSRVASIPMSIYFDLKRKGIIDDQKAMKAWLNDANNRFFRTRPGRI